MVSHINIFHNILWKSETQYRHNANVYVTLWRQKFGTLNGDEDDVSHWANWTITKRHSARSLFTLLYLIKGNKVHLAPSLYSQSAPALNIGSAAAAGLILE